jgi:hypothetical protein
MCSLSSPQLLDVYGDYSAEERQLLGGRSKCPWGEKRSNSQGQVCEREMSGGNKFTHQLGPVLCSGCTCFSNGRAPRPPHHQFTISIGCALIVLLLLSLPASWGGILAFLGHWYQLQCGSSVRRRQRWGSTSPGAMMCMHVRPVLCFV